MQELKIISQLSRKKKEKRYDKIVLLWRTSIVTMKFQISKALNLIRLGFLRVRFAVGVGGKITPCLRIVRIMVKT